MGGRVAVINLHSAPFTQGKTEWTQQRFPHHWQFQWVWVSVGRPAQSTGTMGCERVSHTSKDCCSCRDHSLPISSIFSPLIPSYFTPSCYHPPSPSPLRESNHSSPANQKEEEPIKHHSGNLSSGSWCYEPCSGEGRGVTGESYTAVPRWDKVGIVMGITYQDLPSCLLLTHKHTAVEPLESAVILVPNEFEGLICEFLWTCKHQRSSMATLEPQPLEFCHSVWSD